MGKALAIATKLLQEINNHISIHFNMKINHLILY